MDRKDEDSNTKDGTGLTIDHLSSSGWKHHVSSFTCRNN